MPRPTTVYDAVLISPLEPNITFYIDTGEPLSLAVWQDNETMAKLVKCDLCGRFMPLTGENLSTAGLKKHRGKTTCREYMKKYAIQKRVINNFHPIKARITYKKGPTWIIGHIFSQGIYRIREFVELKRIQSYNHYTIFLTIVVVPTDLPYRVDPIWMADGTWSGY